MIFISNILILNNDDTSNINVYVGDDEKIHFVNKDGADTVIPFSKGSEIYTITGNFTTSPSVYIPYPTDINILDYDIISIEADNLFLTVGSLEYLYNTYNGIIFYQKSNPTYAYGSFRIRADETINYFWPNIPLIHCRISFLKI